MLVTEDYKINQLSSNTDHIPENDISIIQSLKGLYDLDPHLMLYKVIIKNSLKKYFVKTIIILIFE